jgi:hypothetical protein
MEESRMVTGNPLAHDEMAVEHRRRPGRATAR